MVPGCKHTSASIRGPSVAHAEQTKSSVLISAKKKSPVMTDVFRRDRRETETTRSDVSIKKFINHQLSYWRFPGREKYTCAKWAVIREARRHAAVATAGRRRTQMDLCLALETSSNRHVLYFVCVV